MPYVEGGSAEAQELFPGAISKTLAGKALWPAPLTVLEITLSPGAEVPLHVHPTHEEATLVAEGEVQATLGDETRTVRVGDAVLIPAGIVHRIVNATDRPARILGIFPTDDPKRAFPDQGGR